MVQWLLDEKMRRAEMREDIIARVCRREESNKPENVKTSLPYFGVKLSCVFLMFAYRKKSNDL